MNKNAVTAPVLQNPTSSRPEARRLPDHLTITDLFSLPIEDIALEYLGLNAAKINAVKREFDALSPLIFGAFKHADGTLFIYFVHERITER
jgi:hypothetical protein